MAVPKRRVSKAKKNSRKANWKKKAKVAAEKSFSLAKAMLEQKSNSFIYNLYEEKMRMWRNW